MSAKSYLSLAGALATALVMGANSVLVLNLQPPLGNSTVNRTPNVNILLCEGLDFLTGTYRLFQEMLQ